MSCETRYQVTARGTAAHRETHKLLLVTYQGLNLLASVGQGAERTTHQPRLVVMPYIGNPTQAHDRVALVGKGITFDSGGLNLKPTGFMETMHADMGGAAAVLGAMYAIIRLKLPINVGKGLLRWKVNAHFGPWMDCLTDCSCGYGLSCLHLLL